MSCLDSTPHPLVNLSLSSSPLSSSITPTLFHSRLKTYLFNKSFPPQDFFYLLDCLMIMGPDRTYHAYQFIFSFTFIYFLFIPCGRLSWLPVSFLLHVKHTISYCPRRPLVSIGIRSGSCVFKIPCSQVR